MLTYSRLLPLTLAFIVAFAAGGALAAVPEPWQLNFQPPASPVMERIDAFHDMLLVIIFGISFFVLGLLAYICIRFNEKANPKPSKFTHNTLLEVVWTTIPVLILITIAIPSFRLLYFMDKAEEPEMTLKVIGYQWYWGYEYPDHGNIAFDSYMIKDEDLKPGQPRLLATDTNVVLPVDTTVRVLITAADVIHAWAVPALGVKMDAVPGRLNETWLKITKPGMYYGQCSELCGVYHGFMPIAIEALPKDKFEQWVKRKKKELANTDEVDTTSPQPAIVQASASPQPQ